MRAGIRRQREGGVVLPSWVAFASLTVVGIALLAFFVAGSPQPDPEATPAADRGPAVTSGAPDPTTDPTKDAGSHARQGQHQHAGGTSQPATPQAYVEVYNNSTISGLAAQTASELQDAGWNVVGTDNWYGNIPETTVYYPDRLRAQARLLAADLGVGRVRPAVSPMRFDRLTVILTAAA